MGRMGDIIHRRAAHRRQEFVRTGEDEGKARKSLEGNWRKLGDKFHKEQVGVSFKTNEFKPE